MRRRIDVSRTRKASKAMPMPMPMPMSMMLMLLLMVSDVGRFRRSVSVSAAAAAEEAGAVRWKRSEGGENAASSTDLNATLPLFDVSDFTVIGPTEFPKPTDRFIVNAGGGGDVGGVNLRGSASVGVAAGATAVPHLQPVLGRHRPDQDAVMALATEYAWTTHLTFVESLQRTAGFEGDIVIGISALDWEETRVKEYFKNCRNVVLYVLELSCLTAELEEVRSAKSGMRVCQIHGLYGEASSPSSSSSSSSSEPLRDPRPHRTLASTRYELYWLWSLHYEPHSWIMLVDARDTYFQSNPFATVPRAHPSDQDGLLFFFGENAEATRIGLSTSNRKWVSTAYGETVVSALEHKPTICSGSTMGEQIALETYLRAMVSESDETGVVLVGADQGFHNFLYYSNKLSNANAIRGIAVFAQGWGIINNLGAMRTKDPSAWGNGKMVEVVDDGNPIRNMTVYNWDGTVSPVIHQFDRHKSLSQFVYKRRTAELRKAYFDDLGLKIQRKREANNG